jgi:FeS assembly SUF system protein
MNDDSKPHNPIPLNVLPHSNKVEELKREIVNERQSPHLTSNKPSEPTGRPTMTPSPDATVQKKLLEGKVIEAIRTVYDPEIPINIYELGLIYKIEIADDHSVRIEMTLTAPACPVAGTLPNEVATRVKRVEGVTDAEVVLVWEPAWDKSRMTEAALLDLGLL